MSDSTEHNQPVSFWRKQIDRYKADRHFVKLFGNAAALLGSSTTVSVLELAQVLVLTRLLQPAGYGTLTLIITYVAMINQFLDVRVRETAVKFGAQFYSAGDFTRLAAVLKVSFLVDAVIALTSFLLIALTATFGAKMFLPTSELPVAHLVQLYGITLLIGCIKGTNNSILTVCDRFKWMSFYGVCMAVTELLLVTGAAFSGFGIKGVLIALIVGESVRAVVSTILARAAMRNIISLRQILRASFSQLGDQRAQIRRLMLHSNFMAYFRMMNTKVDLLIVGAFRPPAEVGAYKLARSLGTAIVRLSDPFFAAILPDLSRLWANRQIAEFKALILKTSLMMGCVMVAAALSITLLSEQIVQIVSGPEYLHAAPLLAIVVWGFAIGGGFFWTWPAAVSVGRAGFGTKLGLFLCPMQLIISLLLTPKYGAVGNAFGLLSTYLVGQPILAYLVWRELSRKQAPNLPPGEAPVLSAVPVIAAK